MDVFNSVMNILNILSLVCAVISVVSTSFLVYKFFKSMKKLKIDLPCGSFDIRKCNCNASNLTNLTSFHFYGGGKIPEEIRRELIKYTAPMALKVKQKSGYKVEEELLDKKD